jgi:DNA-binding MarR family transcriptional regulator
MRVKKSRYDHQMPMYNWIVEYVTTHGRSPSVREIEKARFVSRPIVIKTLNKLEDQGLIERTRHQARSIRLKTSS